MKLTIDENRCYKEDEAILRTAQMTRRLRSLARHIRQFDRKLPVSDEKGSCHLAFDDIYYIESLDGKTIVNTISQSFLYQDTLTSLEQLLHHTSFCRISKSTLLNIQHLTHAASYVNHRLLLTLDNHEQLIVNRSYINRLKTKLKEEIL